MSKRTFLTSVVVGKKSSLSTRQSHSELQEPQLALKGKVEPMGCLMPPRYAGGCFSVRFSADGTRLVAGFANGAVQLYEKDQQGKFEKPSTLRKGSRYSDDTIMGVRFHPKESQYAYSCCVVGTVYKHTLNKETADKCQKFCDETTNRINTIDLNMTGEWLASGGKDLNLRIYDTKTQEIVTSYDGFGHKTASSEQGGHALSIFCIKFHPDHREVLLSGGWDDTVKIWDLRSGSGVVGSLGGPHICGDAIDLRGEIVVTGSWTAENAIQLWDLRERRPIKALGTQTSSKVQGDNLYSVQFARTDPDGNHVLTAGSGSNSFQYINHNSGKALVTGTTAKPFHTIDSYGRVLVAAGGDSWIRLLNLPTRHRS